MEMEHVLERMQGHADGWRQCLLNEWESGQYENREDCPSYAGCKALNDAMNILRKYDGVKTWTMRDFVLE